MIYHVKLRTDTDSDCLIYHDNIKILHTTTCMQFLEHFLFLISIRGDTVKLGLLIHISFRVLSSFSRLLLKESFTRQTKGKYRVRNESFSLLAFICCKGTALYLALNKYNASGENYVTLVIV